jgi:hypothetical protein
MMDRVVLRRRWMSTAIQLLDYSSQRNAASGIRQFCSGSSAENSPEHLLWRVSELQTEIRLLREQLARTAHALVRYQALLRNAAQRELELHAELVKGIF